MRRAGDPLLARWLERLQACDLEGLADLYAPDATISAASESWHGREEIEDGLSLVGRYLRPLAVDRVEATSSETGLAFETWVRGRLGRAHVRHHWTLDGGRIVGHTLEWVGRGAASAGAA